MIDDICKHITLIDDAGIYYEILASLSSDNRVAFFDTYGSSDINKYFIDVRLKNYDHSDAKNIFQELVNFIQYSKFTFYTRTVNEQKTSVYELVTANDDEKGFYCKVTFH